MSVQAPRPSVPATRQAICRAARQPEQRQTAHSFAAAAAAALLLVRTRAEALMHAHAGIALGLIRHRNLLQVGSPALARTYTQPAPQEVAQVGF